MLSRFAKISLVGTSLAPIFLTLWFQEFQGFFKQPSNSLDVFWGFFIAGKGFIITTVLLLVLCWLLIYFSRTQLEKLPIKISTVKTADSEIVGFVLVYLLPLMNESQNPVSKPMLLFIGALFFFIVYSSNSYHFNPLLGFLGFHFYEVEIEGGITFILISKRNINNCKSIHTVVQISEYMVLETENAAA
jgi:hypothetical protein